MGYGVCTGTRASLYFLSQVSVGVFLIKFNYCACIITTIWLYIYMCLHYIFIHNILHMPDFFILICSELLEMVMFSDSDTSIFWCHELKKQNNLLFLVLFRLESSFKITPSHQISGVPNTVSALVCFFWGSCKCLRSWRCCYNCAPCKSPLNEQFMLFWNMRNLYWVYCC